MILIFGGTTEGRLAADVCDQSGKPFYYSTKGSMQDVEMHNGVRLTGAMSAEDIVAFCREHDVTCIVDAAHPFAENLHREIAQTGLQVVRLERSYADTLDGVTYCDDYDDAIRRMEQADVHCLLALSGANTISKLKPYWQQHRTIFRILPRAESIDVAKQNSLPDENIIFYNNDLTIPTVDSEVETMRACRCDAILTKQSGESGGFMAKVEAAQRLGISVFVVKAPRPSYPWCYVSGRHTLRRAIEHFVPEFFPLRTGLTTGACATAAAKAAVMSLLFDELPEEVSFALPDGEVLSIPVECTKRGSATVVKPDNDDPDVTKGCRITVSASRDVTQCEAQHIAFTRGEGVGMVTLPGLGIPVGEPAINPTPRRMIEQEIRALTADSLRIEVSVADGAEIARRTFNHKVGVTGGISIIGTSGIVHPLSNEAFIESIRREMQVARAVGCKQIALVSGMKSERRLRESLPEASRRYVHYGNFIGEALKAAQQSGFTDVVIGIMIGKAVKLAEGHLDTHSHKVTMNKAFLRSLAPDQSEHIDSITMARQLWDFMPPSFFERLRGECLKHCKAVFPHNIDISIICDNEQQS